ncbi:uncharacterized protein [Paramormyrops kingsleyae]|uniref:uncharacterized protein n=1 Tax=Paramormyrops kingsleyae TaxID=1676925 RepID=UPI003B97456A
MQESQARRKKTNIIKGREKRRQISVRRREDEKTPMKDDKLQVQDVGLVCSPHQEIRANEVQEVWQKEACEVVVAVVPSKEGTVRYTLRHREFLTLKPDAWLMGEVIEAYIQAVCNTTGEGKRLFNLNHYTTQIILTGSREEVARCSMKRVHLDQYHGVVGFFNTGAHWKLICLNAVKEIIAVLDPNAHCETEDSARAAKRFSEFFKMRRIQHGLEDWVDIKWKPSTIEHTKQTDSSSCGVFVMKMAAEMVTSFPDLPDEIIVPPSKPNIRELRLQMAKFLLSSSEKKRPIHTLGGAVD